MADLDWQDGAPPEITSDSTGLTPGRWLMRNGHTAELRRQVDIPYKDGKGAQRTYRIWVGRCVDCDTPMSWTFWGFYAAAGIHRNDLMEKEKPAAD